MNYHVLMMSIGLCLLTTIPLNAQSDVITLDDSTPGIDVAVSSTAGTTGAVSLGLSGVSVNVIDDMNNSGLELADQRVHGLELHFSPQATTHSIQLQKLSIVQTAYVSVSSQMGLTPAQETTLINTPSLAIGQEVDVSNRDRSFSCF